MMRDDLLYVKYRASGMGIQAAVSSVKRHRAFVRRLRADVAEHKKRSRAAKRGWKARRAAAV